MLRATASSRSAAVPFSGSARRKKATINSHCYWLYTIATHPHSITKLEYPRKKLLSLSSGCGQCREGHLLSQDNPHPMFEPHQVNCSPANSPSLMTQRILQSKKICTLSLLKWSRQLRAEQMLWFYSQLQDVQVSWGLKSMMQCIFHCTNKLQTEPTWYCLSVVRKPSLWVRWTCMCIQCTKINGQWSAGPVATHSLDLLIYLPNWTAFSIFQELSRATARQHFNRKPVLIFSWSTKVLCEGSTCAMLDCATQ